MPTVPVSAGTCLFRLNHVAYDDPAYFGVNQLHRFDAPDSSYGVCYLGTTLACCFLEVLSATRTKPAAPWIVTEDDIGAYYAAIATVSEPLQLAWLADEGLARLGIDQRHTGGDDYTLSQAWSAAIHSHASAVDGIFYASRHHNGLYSLAVFNRAKHKLSFERWGTLADRAIQDLWVATERILTDYAVIVMPGL